MPRPLRLAATAALAFMPLGAARPVLIGRANAQLVTVDEGSFTVTRGGAKIGREEFRIVRQGPAGGGEYVARALAAYGDRRVAPALQADAEGGLLRYQVEVRGAAGVEERLTGQVEGPRFRVQMRTPRGEAAREYMIAGPTVVVDDELFHQLFFVSLGDHAGDGDVATVMPRRNVQGATHVSRTGADPVVISGRSIPATRLAVTTPDGVRRDVWIDGGGRVLKVSVPGTGTVALRDDPPR
jgi:hypothetical protein